MQVTVISGERIQQLCDVYIGDNTDTNWSRHNPKCMSVQSIISPFLNNLRILTTPSSKKKWNNPYRIFCYGQRIHDFRQLLPYIQNPYILITHNSDQNITGEFTDIMNHHLLRGWFAQNLLVRHPKASLIPIGIANSHWGHGDISALEYVCCSSIPKKNAFYFYFSVSTNHDAREPCKTILESMGLRFGSSAPKFILYLKQLASYKYAICPPGNGVDSHRIWESLYLGVIPVVIRSVFTEQLSERFPCILLDTWEQFNAEELLATYVPPKRAKYYKHLDLKNILHRG